MYIEVKEYLNKDSLKGQIIIIKEIYNTINLIQPN